MSIQSKYKCKLFLNPKDPGRDEKRGQEKKTISTVVMNDDEHFIYLDTQFKINMLYERERINKSYISNHGFFIC